MTVDVKMDSCLRRNDNVIQLSGIGGGKKAQPGAAVVQVNGLHILRSSIDLRFYIGFESDQDIYISHQTAPTGLQKGYGRQVRD